MQSEGSRDGLTDNSGEKILSYSTDPRFGRVESTETQFCGFHMKHQQQFIVERGSDDLQTCIDGETLVSFVSYVMQLEWKLEFRERFILRRVLKARKCFQMKVEGVRVNETFKLTKDNVPAKEESLVGY